MAPTDGIFTIIICIILLSFSRVNEAKVIEGGIMPRMVNGEFVTWEFITRFCFKSEASRAEFEIYYPKWYYMETLLLYYDVITQWPSVYPGDGLTCTQKLNRLRGQNQMLTLYTSNNVTPHKQHQEKYPWMKAWFNWVRCDEDLLGQMIVCKFELSFRSRRDRWWYIAISNCESTRGIALQYRMNLTNGPADNIFFHHFSADEFYILPFDLGFLCVEFIILIVTGVVAYYLDKLDFFHVTFRIFIAALVLEIAHMLIMCIKNGVYANTGQESNIGEYLGLIVQAVSYILFIIVLILMGKGYTITRGRLRTVTVIKITVFIVIYILLYLAMFLWEMMIFDEGLVIYRYASIPGAGLVIMRVIAWIWFLYGVIFTLKHYPEKKLFYVPFVVFYSLWFLTGPIFVLIAVIWIPNWVRASAVNGVENFVTTLGFVFFLIITRPSKANSNFPFRIRTWQIAAMEGEDTPETDGPAPAYGVAAKYVSDDDNVDIFTASDFRKPKAQTVGNIDKFPHHQENDTSHFEIAVNPCR